MSSGNVPDYIGISLRLNKWILSGGDAVDPKPNHPDIPLSIDHTRIEAALLGVPIYIGISLRLNKMLLRECAKGFSWTRFWTI